MLFTVLGDCASTFVPDQLKSCASRSDCLHTGMDEANTLDQPPKGLTLIQIWVYDLSSSSNDASYGTSYTRIGKWDHHFSQWPAAAAYGLQVYGHASLQYLSLLRVNDALVDDFTRKYARQCGAQ